MGTRFIATKECIVHDAFKQKIVDAAETDTALVMESLQNPARVLRNAWAEKVLHMEAEGASLEELGPMITGQLSRSGWVEGKLEEGLYGAGQVVGRIHDVPSVSELIQRIVDEALEVKQKLNRII
jgi:NAD(P)H-dependent flavin oxidoreductase YrpB (nitropropane dioxygenase family)